jgi:hypothetical protein
MRPEGRAPGAVSGCARRDGSGALAIANFHASMFIRSDDNSPMKPSIMVFQIVRRTAN